MSWQPYIMLAFAVIAVALLFGLLALVDFQREFTLGACIGLAASIGLLIFGEVTTRRALATKQKSAGLGHVIGGFALRIVVLVVGFAVLTFTGFANPGTFALAFLAGVLLMLGWHVMRAVKQMQTA